MTWHATGKYTEPGKMQHPIDGRAWKNFDTNQFPNKDTKEEFLGWFGSQIRQRHVDKDLGVSASSNLFALACELAPTPISVNSCVVNGVRFVMYSYDKRHTTQNSSICSPGDDEEMYYDGQSIDVDAPPDIINVDEDDDIIDDEEVLPYNLADFDDEDVFNVDDNDGVAVVYSNVARGHGGDGGGDDRPPSIQLAGGCRGKGTQKSNLGGRKAGRMHTRKETRNLGLRKITNELGPQFIRLEWKDNGTMLPLGDHYNSPGRKARVLEKIGKIRMRKFGFGMIPRTCPEEMLRLQGLGTYIDDQIIAMVRGGKQRRHIPGVGRVLAGSGKDVLVVPHESGSGSRSGAGEDDESSDDKDIDEDEEDTDS
nr:hypothetical protein [Tanacetum cinerariifolium]